MPLVTLDEVSIGFRGPPLLDGVTCRIDAGQRIGLLGPNGAGKTTLLRLLTGDVEPDRGKVALVQGTRVALLPQDVPRDMAGAVFDVVFGGLPPASENKGVGSLCSPGASPFSTVFGKQRLPTPLFGEDQWRHERSVEQILARMELDGSERFERLSSGMKRRVLLARALVAEPELLLLDEPTNHLDLDAIEWLERFLDRWAGTLIFVTHDRVFLRKLAGRILEIDRGRLFDWSCDYETFLARKEAWLEAEEKQNALFDKRLAQEEKWIRQGILARRTRNEGRVQALEAMRRSRAARRSNPGAVRLAIAEAARSGNLVAQVEGVSFAYGDRPIVRGFSTVVMRGDRVGVIGPNGAGKTTLLRLVLGQLPPQEGTVRLGTNLKVAYFDQLREQLKEEQSVEENVGDGYESVGEGSKSRHLLGYLKGFLFSPERARTAVRFLSGGERNRVLLAKLFAKPANVIVLDEPTNDLDTETLELLEARLVEFKGTVLLVSHDRQFLNNVVTSSIVFEDGQIREYVGGYDDWQRQRAEQASAAAADQPSKAPTPRRPVKASTAQSRGDDSSSATRRRLTYKEKLELAELPEQIERLDAEIAELHARMAEPAFYQQPGEQIAAEQTRLKQWETQLAAAYARWEALEELNS